MMIHRTQIPILLPLLFPYLTSLVTTSKLILNCYRFSFSGNSFAESLRPQIMKHPGEAKVIRRLEPTFFLNVHLINPFALVFELIP